MSVISFNEKSSFKNDLKRIIIVFLEKKMLLIFEKRSPKSEHPDEPRYIQFPTVHDYLGIDISDEEEEWYMQRGYDPTLLTVRKKFFYELTADQIMDIEIVEEYTDDHEPCIDVHITFTTGDILSVALMYTSLTGAFQYWEDSLKARQDIVDYFNEYGDPEYTW